MFALVAAIIAVVGSVVSNLIGAQHAKYQQDVANDQAKIDYERNKVLAAYNLLSEREKQEMQLAAIVVIAMFLFLVLLVVVKPKKLKK